MHAVNYENVEAINILLSAGSDPWSNKFVSYETVIKSDQTRYAIKIARKLDISVSLSTLNKKRDCWVQVFPFIEFFPHSFV